MNKITKICGKCIPLEMNDVDTDLIIPAQYLTSTSQKGYGENLFKRLKDQSPEFVFNQHKYLGASILITKENFGCGSSREHAVWALQEYGIQAIIASSFADIFSGNSLKNRLILIQMDKEIINKLILNSKKNDYFLDIHIVHNKIYSSLDEDFSFEMDNYQKSCFINGFDEFDYLLSFRNKIEEFKQQQIKDNIIPSYNRNPK
ncbi:3-isopropylmalate dehydratase small subunit [Silvanigrella aquatica]|uniref:3-isopropylmalate dehydratase n=1 Tax=Silvanigrella aquatica TaxID=1915309 RepID=A0A1L4D283_9BACT|nr:3-isopropylmalate dehydratase small subunit [Silvanigrella aquatica]APJ04300.1 3-isopropylmalate dehydratase small subunit [Silvanigrella aquatica]